MSRLKIGMSLSLPLFFLMSAGTVRAATLHVNCGGKVGLTSIGAALKALKNSESHEPSTINVSGTCNEDVGIQSMDHLTLNAVNGASINDPSQGANATLVIDDSRDVAINGFVINGYAAGTSGNDVVDCQDASVCRFSGNTVQNAPQGAGIGAYAGAYADIEGGIVQNNGWTGLAVFRSARVRAVGISSRGNGHGAVVAEGGHLQLISSTSANNLGFGIQMRQGAALSCNACTITGNAGFGINAEENSVVTLNGNSTVTGNVGAGINLTNLSSVSFWDSSGNVTGNNGGQGDIVCNPHYTTVTGSPATLGKVVNCP